jgi:hypothetical protein
MVERIEAQGWCKEFQLIRFPVSCVDFSVATSYEKICRKKIVIDLQGMMSWSKDFLFPGTGTSYQSKLECKMAEKRKLKAN